MKTMREIIRESAFNLANYPNFKYLLSFPKYQYYYYYYYKDIPYDFDFFNKSNKNYYGDQWNVLPKVQKSFSTLLNNTNMTIVMIKIQLKVSRQFNSHSYFEKKPEEKQVSLFSANKTIFLELLNYSYYWVNLRMSKGKNLRKEN